MFTTWILKVGTTVDLRLEDTDWALGLFATEIDLFIWQTRKNGQIGERVGGSEAGLSEW